MTRAALDAFRRTVTVEWPRTIEKEARAHLIATAKAGHAKIMGEQTSRGGVAPTFEAFANRPGKPVESVVLPGPIVYKYGYLREVIVAALNALRAASPVVSGAYRNSHMVFVNGVAVAEVPAVLRPEDDIMIANPVPYARRLEVGKTKSGRSFVVQVPDHIYQRTAKALRARYRNVADVSFGFATLPRAYKIKGRLAATYGVLDPSVAGAAKSKKWSSIPEFVRKDFVVQRRRQQARHIGKSVQSPAIIIKAFA